MKQRHKCVTAKQFTLFSRNRDTSHGPVRGFLTTSNVGPWLGLGRGRQVELLVGYNIAGNPRISLFQPGQNINSTECHSAYLGLQKIELAADNPADFLEVTDIVTYMDIASMVFTKGEEEKVRLGESPFNTGLRLTWQANSSDTPRRAYLELRRERVSLQCEEADLSVAGPHRSSLVSAIHKLLGKKAGSVEGEK